MNSVLFWVSSFDKEVPFENWERFINAMGFVVILTVVLSVFAIAALYNWSAFRKRISTPGDLFAPYTPMYWLLLCILSGLTAGVISAVEYDAILGTEGTTGAGKFVVSTEIFGGTLLSVCLLAWLCILLMPFLTPSKFRYRPLWLFVKRRGVRQ